MGGGPRGHVIFEGPQEHLGESGSHISKQGKWSQVGLINIGKYGRLFIWIELMHRPGKMKTDHTSEFYIPKMLLGPSKKAGLGINPRLRNRPLSKGAIIKFP